jgi:hypothetical protein
LKRAVDIYGSPAGSFGTANKIQALRVLYTYTSDNKTVLKLVPATNVVICTEMWKKNAKKLDANFQYSSCHS